MRKQLGTFFCIGWGRLRKKFPNTFTLVSSLPLGFKSFSLQRDAWIQSVCQTHQCSEINGLVSVFWYHWLILHVQNFFLLETYSGFLSLCVLCVLGIRRVKGEGWELLLWRSYLWYKMCLISWIIHFKNYLFIWLCQLLFAEHRFSCSMWDLGFLKWFRW